jgi:short-subunit dehydrogenase
MRINLPDPGLRRDDKMKKFTHSVITGASSGIGAALARLYARPGVRLGLTGRDAARLEEVAGACRAMGAEAIAKIIDVTDRAGMEKWLIETDEAQPIDLVIANAGISAGMGDSRAGESPAQVRKLFDVNLTGVLNTIDPVLPRMISRGHGSLALMSSLAAFRGWPGAPAYCATKAAVKSYGEGLRGAIARTGVNVHVICPGFVRSRMTAVNKFPMPLLMDAERAAEKIAAGIVRNRGRIAFPFPLHFFAWLCGAAPDFIAQKILGKMPAKASEPEALDSNIIS